jgi:hypothetical protein
MGESGGEMLVGDGDRALFPEAADPPHRRRDDPGVERLQAHPFLQALEGDPLGGGAVGGAQRVSIAARDPPRRPVRVAAILFWRWLLRGWGDGVYRTSKAG